MRTKTLIVSSLLLLACKDDDKSATGKTDELVCAESQEICAGECVSTARDPLHCGACGNACGDGELCSAGECVVSCGKGSGLAACGESCVDLRSDEAHCGACDEVCDAGESCVEGACQQCIDGAIAELDAVTDVIGDGAKDDFLSSCTVLGENGKPQGATGDRMFTFTAPEAGSYELVLEEANFDGKLGLLLSSCGGEETACGPTSQALEVSLTKGQLVVIAVDGLDETSTGKLSVRTKVEESGLCCSATPEAGCDASPELEACVCAYDPVCCNTSWDVYCVAAIVDANCGSCGQPVYECEPSALTGELPFTVTGTTTDKHDTMKTSCGGKGSNDVTLSYKAPAAGIYTFSTAGSDFDTVLSVMSGACTSELLSCNDDMSDILQSQVVVELAKDQEVTVVIDGVAETGSYSLTVSAAAGGQFDPCCDAHDSAGCGSPAIEACVCTGAEASCCTGSWTEACAEKAVTSCGMTCDSGGKECSAVDLGSTVPQNIDGTTIGGYDVVDPECSLPDAPEARYWFTAPRAGGYTFSTVGSQLDTVVYLLPAACSGDQITCSDDVTRDIVQSKASAMLEAGERVMVVVDGFTGQSGNFQLKITELDTETGPGTCCLPTGELGCSNAEIEACVCAVDDVCCNGAWDEICVTGVDSLGCGTCL